MSTRATPLPCRSLAPVSAVLLGLALGGCVVAPVAPVGPHVVRPAPPVVRVPPPAPPVAAMALPLYFYPQRGQTEALQERDRFECYRWAVQQTGTDPGMTPVRGDDPRWAAPRPPLPPAGPRADAGDVVAGAVTGAAIGALASGPRHAGSNAVIGAIFGAAIGAAAGEARNRAIDDAQARQEAAIERRRAAAAAAAAVPADNFRRAMSACMQGRGYQVP